MKRKIAATLLSFIMATVFIAPAQISAQTTGDIESQFISGGIISPMSLYTNYTSTSLSISSGTATCYGSLMGYQGITTSVTIYLYLEKYVSGYWSAQASWSQSFGSYYGTLEKTKGSLSSGTYRVRASYYAYSGSNYENIVGYSQSVVY